MTSPSRGDAEHTLRWSVEQRLAFIEERLFWIGEVNRTDLVRRFGVSMSQASADIARYLARTPRGVSYDKSAKRYVAGDDFRPVLGAPDSARLLGELRLVDLGVMPATETMLGTVPPFDATPVPQRPIDSVTLRAIVRAIREHRTLEVTYQSMSRSEPIRRAIEPHALAHDGFRWHTRAFDREVLDFRDFVLGRITKPKLGDVAQSRPEDDRDWQSSIVLKIAPHSGLTAAQARAIATDYGIRGTSASIPVRRALLFYALKRLGLDVGPDARPPNVQHIVLVNRNEIEQALDRQAEV
ncbi:MAG: WYL domain-containing protein [Xanthobacteraceae bacterium]|nr:WYL domain-containing protein [Xanthobacteraceae bacterium]PWB57675.1 MAG: WYL domain-containing protein [Bradyrhizobiaceae bacterium]